MGIFRPLKTSNKPEGMNGDIEAEIGELVGKAPPRHSRDNESELTTEIISDGIQRVAGEPLAQISRMIAELTDLRDHLQNEGERVQDEIERVDNEIAGYTQMSEAAVQSIRVIDQAVGEFRRAARPISGTEPQTR
jgi:t-SNARE complex subunit (syntaxin)